MATEVPNYKKNKWWPKFINGLWTVLSTISPTFATKLVHKRYLNYPLNLDNPKTLNEKLQWLKLNTYYKNDTVRQCADKVAVRSYIKSKGLEEILINSYGSWDKAKDIPWDNLPQSFVLKSNTGSQRNLLVTDKRQLNIEETETMVNDWLSDKNYGPRNVEFSYNGIKNRVLAESFIDSEDGDLIDYKFFCNYGEVRFLYVVSNRLGDEFYLNYYDEDGQPIQLHDSIFKSSDKIMKMPDNFEIMKKYASILSKDFPIVRVDLYSEFGKIYFGELTFLPTGGRNNFGGYEQDLAFGQMFDISDAMSKER